VNRLRQIFIYSAFIAGSALALSPVAVAELAIEDQNKIDCTAAVAAQMAFKNSAEQIRNGVDPSKIKQDMDNIFDSGAATVSVLYDEPDLATSLYRQAVQKYNGAIGQALTSGDRAQLTAVMGPAPTCLASGK